MPPLVETLTEDHRWDALGLPGLAEAAAGATLRRLGLDPAAYEISCLGCSDARIQDLNADFRGKPRPTNVLSWPSAERAPARAGAMPRLPPAGAPGGGAAGGASGGGSGGGPAPLELGDIAIAYETCEAEARAAGLDLGHHATHLLVHGTLHLLGFDHEREADADLMERFETEILAGLGIPDPFGVGGAAAKGDDDV